MDENMDTQHGPEKLPAHAAFRAVARAAGTVSINVLFFLKQTGLIFALQQHKHHDDGKQLAFYTFQLAKSRQ